MARGHYRWRGPRIDSVFGNGAKTKYRQDEPELEVKVTRDDGDELIYGFSKPAGENYCVLKRDEVDHYFKAAEFTVDPIKETLREQLVRSKAGENSGDATNIRAEPKPL